MAERPDNIQIQVPVGLFQGSNLYAVKYTVVYRVNNIKGLTKGGQHTFLQSPSFHVGQSDQYQARIVCHIKGGCPVVAGCKGNGCTYVQFLKQDQSEMINQRLQISLSFILIHAQTKSPSIYPITGQGMTLKQFEDPTMTTITSWGECFSRKGPHSNWVRDGILTIECDITIHISENPAGHNLLFNGLAKTQNATMSQTYLLDDIKRLLNNAELADVTLKVGDKTVKVHKVILAARSPVFARMFQTDMVERKGNVVEISDMDFGALQGLIVYMYTDNVPNMGDLGEDLLSAAEKYQIEGLKVKCEASLAKGLTVANAARIFMAADLHRAKSLKARAVDFIQKNRDQVFVTNEWKRAKEIKPLELATLFL